MITPSLPLPSLSLQRPADPAVVQAVLNPHFNLLDLHECGRMGQQVQIFEDKQDLLEYTQDTGRYYPLVPAKADPLLTHLLREIYGEYMASRPNT
jgi:hypothetical protein